MASTSAVPSDRVIKPHPQSGFDLLIFTMYEKPGWQPRVPGSQTRAPHPGSAIDYGGQLYEVIDIGPGQGTAHTYRYGLRKWEDRFVVRRIFPYSAETERAVAGQIQERRKRYRRHSWLIYTFPLSTWLPSPMLQRWQSEWGLPMYGLSLASALLFFIPCADLTLYYLYFGASPGKGVPAILAYIALEQAARAVWIVLSRQAQGSLLFTAVWYLLNPLEGKSRKPKDYVSPAFADEVRHLREQPWDAEVHTIFRDPVLLGNDPVLIDGNVYEPLSYVQQGTGLSRRYIFRLKQLEPGVAARREYTRQRTSESVTSLMRYERRRDHVQRWALLYGFLPAKHQLELEREYDFLSAQATSYSAALMLGACLLKLIFMFGVRFDYSHAVAVYLAVESAYRLALAQARGEPTGSLFGWLLLPFLPR